MAATAPALSINLSPLASPTSASASSSASASASASCSSASSSRSSISKSATPSTASATPSVVTPLSPVTPASSAAAAPVAQPNKIAQRLSAENDFDEDNAIEQKKNAGNKKLSKKLVPIPWNDDALKGYERGKTGGLLFVNYEIISKQKGVLLHMIKKLGSNILQGKSPLNISFPVKVFEGRSYLQRLPEQWCFAPIYLRRAAKEKTPVERLKHVIAFVFSGLYLAAKQEKPFNPLLGETCHMQFEDGTDIFLEQVSHHPPITAWEMSPPGGEYSFYGHGELTAKLGANSLVGKLKGTNVVEFCDGSKISYSTPPCLISGTVMGSRIFLCQEKMKFTDSKNNLEAEIDFSVNQQGMFNFWSSKGDLDVIKGTIVDTSNQKVLSSIEGCWLDYLEFDSKRFWTMKKYSPFAILPGDKDLPSDSRYRDDIKALIAGDIDKSQQLKEEIEDRQRAEASQRKKLGGGHA